jgi:hypothetical protein
MLTNVTGATSPFNASLSNTAGSATLIFKPRHQWENNNGYCGEVSFITTGMLLGNYVSQYDIRDLACQCNNQVKESSQLLLGWGGQPGDDVSTARALSIEAVVWN